MSHMSEDTASLEYVTYGSLLRVYADGTLELHPDAVVTERGLHLRAELPNGVAAIIGPGTRLGHEGRDMTHRLFDAFRERMNNRAVES